VKRFQSNNGSKFVNLIIDLFCKKNGIIHETMNLYLPEQKIVLLSIQLQFSLKWFAVCFTLLVLTYAIGERLKKSDSI